MLHRFGPLGGPGGEALLLDALGATRHRLTVVSCFAAADLDPERLRGGGSRLLGDLLAFAAERASAATPARSDGPAVAPAGTRDRLVVDLAERLWRAGLVVQVGFGVAGGATIPLAVGHPDLPGEMLVAVLTDDEGYVAEPSVRVRDRQVPQRLESLGWTVVQVWSAAAFLDPQTEAESIARAVRARLAERLRGAPGAAAGSAAARTSVAAGGGRPVTAPIAVPVPVEEPISAPVPVHVPAVAEALPGEPAAELGSEADDEPGESSSALTGDGGGAALLGDGPEPAASSAVEPPEGAEHPGHDDAGPRAGVDAGAEDDDVSETSAPDGASLHASPGTVGVPSGTDPAPETPR